MSDKMHSRLAELEEELSKLKKAVEYVEGAQKAVISAEKSIKIIGELQKEYISMKETVNALIKIIDKVDFPSRLDKMDATISSTNQNISNTQARVETVERNLKDDFKNKAKDILKSIEDGLSENKEFGMIIKKNIKNLTIISIVILLFTLAITITLLVK